MNLNFELLHNYNFMIQCFIHIAIHIVLDTYSLYKNTKNFTNVLVSEIYIHLWKICTSYIETKKEFWVGPVIVV